MGDEVSRVRHQAARLGNDALHRITDEVERRPLAVLAIVAGIGFLVGIAARRRQ
jgi:hypothetical protein